MGQWVANDLRLRVYDYLEHLSLNYYDTHQTATLLSTITDDVSTIQDFASSSMLGILVDLMMIVGMLGVMFWLNWDFTLVAVAVMPFVLLFVARFKKATHEVRRKKSDIVAVLQQGSSTKRVVKAFGRQELEETRARLLLQTPGRERELSARVAKLTGWEPLEGLKGFFLQSKTTTKSTLVATSLFAWQLRDQPPDSGYGIESAPPGRIPALLFLSRVYSEAIKRRLKELHAPQICEKQEELLLELQQRKEIESDVSSLRETPVYEDGKQLYFLIALLVESDSRFFFTAVMGQRDFFENKFDFPDSARNSGITPEPGVYLPKQSS